MSAGRVLARQTSANRPRKTFNVGVPVPRPIAGGDPRTQQMLAAAVVVKISLRPGDNTDILEALGLIPVGVRS